MIFLTLSILLFLGGFFHLTQPGQRLDTIIFNRLHALLRTFPGSALFQEVWFVGRTPMALFVLLLVTTTRVKRGITAGVIFLIAVTLERALKLTINRPRPFRTKAEVHMSQPTEPIDSSFPSGDCLRVWFIALILLHLLPLHWTGMGLIILLAFVVTLGRIGMGVHYPLDTLSGTGLGVLAGQITVMLWQYDPQLPLSWL